MLTTFTLTAGEQVQEALTRVAHDVRGVVSASPRGRGLARGLHFADPQVATERRRHGAGPTVVGMRRERSDGAALRVVRHAPSTLVIADTASGRPDGLADTVDLLIGLGTVVTGLVVIEGRIPPDPAYA